MKKKSKRNSAAQKTSFWRKLLRVEVSIGLIGVLVAIGAFLYPMLDKYLMDKEKTSRLTALVENTEKLQEKNPKEAFETYTKISETLSLEHNLYGRVKNDEGKCLFFLALIDKKEENIEKAIAAYDEALKIRTINKYPVDYAETQHNLGEAYYELSLVRNKESNLVKAIAVFDAALKIRNINKYPIDYAQTQINLGEAYAGLSKVRDKESNINKAIAAYKSALTIYTVEKYPIDYAMVQINLGETYKELSKIRDKDANLKHAIKHCEEALEIYTEKDYPIYYKQVKSNLEEARGMFIRTKDKPNGKTAVKIVDPYRSGRTNQNCFSKMKILIFVMTRIWGRREGTPAIYRQGVLPLIKR